MKTWQVPLLVRNVDENKKGSLSHWVSSDYRPSSLSAVKFYDVFEFEETLTLTDMASGRSAKYFIWRSADGRTFPMFVKDMLEMLTRNFICIDCGTLRGIWTFCKRGENYGIKLVKVVTE